MLNGCGVNLPAAGSVMPGPSSLTWQCNRSPSRQRRNRPAPPPCRSHSWPVRWPRSAGPPLLRSKTLSTVPKTSGSGDRLNREACAARWTRSEYSPVDVERPVHVRDVGTRPASARRDALLKAAHEFAVPEPRNDTRTDSVQHGGAGQSPTQRVVVEHRAVQRCGERGQGRPWDAQAARGLKAGRPGGRSPRWRECRDANPSIRTRRRGEFGSWRTGSDPRGWVRTLSRS